jgi:transposase-like protein
MARLFPNETSLTRPVTAMSAETNEEWESGKTYLNMACPTQPSV